MHHDPVPATRKPDLDELLTTFGITREQLTEMTADDLFAAAARWQHETTIGGEVRRFTSPADHFLDSLQAPTPDLSRLN